MNSAVIDTRVAPGDGLTDSRAAVVHRRSGEGTLCYDRRDAALASINGGPRSPPFILVFSVARGWRGDNLE
jgi:hypothetical protein